MREICTDNKTSTLAKASALDCTTVWPIEPSMKIEWLGFTTVTQVILILSLIHI